MRLTATQTATAVRRGELTARASVAAALERIERLNKGIGAFALVRTERALAEADAVDARVDRYSLPLAGVAVAVSDQVAVSGEPMRVGSLGSATTVQDRDHEVVRRLRRAGAVVVGLTRVAELGAFATTDSAFGITRNPWNRSRSPGGSAGGAAAAVAAGLVPIAHAADGLGAIRLGAAGCGLVGIKPGLGLVPADVGAGSWFGLVENGALAATVEDAALMLAVMSGRLALADTSVHPSLRIAVSARSPIRGVAVDGEFAAAARAAGDLLGQLGHRVRAADPAYSAHTAGSQLVRWLAGVHDDAGLLAEPHLLEPRTARQAQLGRAVRRLGLPRPAGQRRWHEGAERFFDDFDVLITPTLAAPPPPALAWNARSWRVNVRADMRYAPFTGPWNLAGWPAIAVPFTSADAARTLSVQLVARPGGESVLFGLAAQLEAFHPWPRLARGLD